MLDTIVDTCNEMKVVQPQHIREASITVNPLCAAPLTSDEKVREYASRQSYTSSKLVYVAASFALIVGKFFFKKL